MDSGQNPANLLTCGRILRSTIYGLRSFLARHNLFCSLVLKRESRSQEYVGDSNIHYLGQKFITWVKKNQIHYVGQPK